MAHMNMSVNLLHAISMLLVISSIFDIVEPNHNGDLLHQLQLLAHQLRNGEKPTTETGRELNPPSIPSPAVARHIQTRRWRTRINRRLCSVENEQAEVRDVRTRSECVDLCIDHENGCRAANYIGGALSICELHFCVPIEFDQDIDDCQYIQVQEAVGQPSGSYNKSRTVIFIGGPAMPTEQVFLRGGVSSARRSGCTSDPETDQCAIDVVVEGIGDGEHYDSYNTWRHGNSKLNWHGAQVGQEQFNNKSSLGTPMVLTSSRQSEAGYQMDNVCGNRYWRVDLMMDCSQTDNGWFEVKGYLAGGNQEQDISQAESCNGNAGGRAPFAGSINHIARCGYMNVFEWNSGFCSINHI